MIPSPTPLAELWDSSFGGVGGRTSEEKPSFLRLVIIEGKLIMFSFLDGRGGGA